MHHISAILGHAFSRRAESGQTLVEYSLVIGLIGVTAIITLTALGGDYQALWEVVEQAGTAMSEMVD